MVPTLAALSRNFRLVVAYDGTDFHGWQIQPEAATVQGTLTECLTRILKENVKIHGSGRTDAGAHALGQVANFKTSNTIPEENLLRALNNSLPPSIRVRHIDAVPLEFHARYASRAKIYQYRILNAPFCPPFLWRYVYHHPYRLEVLGMQEAGREFEGEHDFSSFAAMGGHEDRSEAEEASGDSSKVRMIFVASHEF